MVTQIKAFSLGVSLMLLIKAGHLIAAYDCFERITDKGSLRPFPAASFLGSSDCKQKGSRFPVFFHNSSHLERGAESFTAPCPPPHGNYPKHLARFFFPTVIKHIYFLFSSGIATYLMNEFYTDLQRLCLYSLLWCCD